MRPSWIRSFQVLFISYSSQFNRWLDQQNEIIKLKDKIKDLEQMLVEDPKADELGKPFFWLKHFLYSFLYYLFLIESYYQNPLLQEACFPDETLYMTRANGRISMYYESSEQCWNDDDTF